MAIFYLVVLMTGIWASFKSKRKQKKSAATGMEMALLGNRSINWVVGVFTTTGEESPADKTVMETVTVNCKKLFLRKCIYKNTNIFRVLHLVAVKSAGCKMTETVWRLNNKIFLIN